MFKHLPRICLRSAKCNAVRRRAASLLNDELDPGCNPTLILPGENAPCGVDHIIQKCVPEDILRPWYATDSNNTRPPGQASIIPLGGEDEVGIRAACKLARDVLRFAGSLVKARLRFIPQNESP